MRLRHAKEEVGVFTTAWRPNPTAGTVVKQVPLAVLYDAQVAWGVAELVGAVHGQDDFTSHRMVETTDCTAAKCLHKKIVEEKLPARTNVMNLEGTHVRLCLEGLEDKETTQPLF